MEGKDLGGLAECGKHDWKSWKGYRYTATRWGMVSEERRIKGISRKAKRLAKRDKQ